MTRPLVPRVPQLWRPRPLLPGLAMLVMAVGVLASALTGYAAAREHISHAPVAAANHSVQIVNFAFVPAAITVSAGDTITWTNKDAAPHTVTTSSGPQQLNSPNLSTGQSWSFTFTAPGTYAYYCVVHPDMRAQVVVSAVAPTTTPPVTTTAQPPATTSAVSQSHPATTAPHVAATTTMAMTQTSRPTAALPASTTPRNAEAVPSSGALASSAVPASAGSATASSLAAVATIATQAAVAPTGPAGSSTLKPALLLAGLTAAVAVFCLLVVASRASVAHRAPPAQRPDDTE